MTHFDNLMQTQQSKGDGDYAHMITNRQLFYAQRRRDVRVVVIGAGLAGLACADALVNQHGFTNVIL
jgi:malic enzyme